MSQTVPSPEHQRLLDTLRDDTDAVGPERLTRTLRRLVGDEPVARDLVLDATLDALVGTRTAWRRKRLLSFLVELDPSADEIAERQAAYRALLATGAGPAVDHGLVHLGKLERSGRLDVDAFVDSVDPVFALASRGPAMRATTWLARVLAKVLDDAEATGLRERVLTAVTAGLLHPETPVAEGALDLLEAHAPLPAAARAAVAEARPAVAGALTARLDHLVGDADATVEAPPSDDLPAGFPPPLAAVPARPDLATLDPVTPIADRDALVDTASHAAETVRSMETIERLLDGLARFGADRSGDFERRVEALARRFGSEPATEADGPGLANARFGIGRALGSLLRAWLTGRPVVVDSFYGPPKSGPFGFLATRLREVEARVLGRRPPGPLLALPTHVGGWIEASALVERLSALAPEDAATALASADGALALARLAPGDPSVAAELPGLAGRLVRFALGGDEPATEGDPRLWLVAGRTRRPDGDLHEMLGPIADAFADKPDGLSPASWSWRFEASAGSRPSLVLDAGIAASAAPSPPSGRLARLLHRVTHGPRSEPLAVGEWRPPNVELVDLAFTTQSQSNVADSWKIAWLASLWPARVDAVLLGGAKLAHAYFADADARVRPFDAFFEPLAEPFRPWPAAAEPLVGLALVARGKLARAAAVDVSIDAFVDGRADPAALGRALARCVDALAPPLGRATKALEEIARVSPLHEHAVLRLIDGALDHWGSVRRWSTPHGLAGFLRLGHELAIAQGEPVSDGARRGLAKIDGGQAGRLARKLSDHERVTDAPRRLDARRAAWAARAELG